MEDVYDLVDSASICHVVKCEGGAMVVGKVWFKERDEDGNEAFLSKARLHVVTSEAQLSKLVRDYYRANLSEESGSLDE